MLSMLRLVGGIAAAMLDELFANYFSIFLCILLMMYLKNQRQKYSELQSDIYREQSKGFREVVEKLVLTGLVAGFAASLLAVLIGINIEAEALRYIFLAMIILLPFDLRYANISYAAGILAAVSLIFGYPQINIPSLIGLVAILNIVESILIYIERKGDFLPVFIKHREMIAGAFLIRRFWMIPIVFFTYLIQNGGRLQLLGNGAYAIGLDCLIALLSYSDIAVTKHPEKKCTQGSAIILCYGLVILVLAVISQDSRWMVYVSVVLCILGYEAIHFYLKHSELSGKPLYSAVGRGLRVMDVLAGSHAQRMGLKRGDIILSINNNDIQTDAGVGEALKDYPTFTWLRVLGWDGKERSIEYQCFPRGYNSLGIVSVPREKEVTYNTSFFESMSVIRNIVKKVKGIDRPI